jgi:hypothetical protein
VHISTDKPEQHHSARENKPGNIFLSTGIDEGENEPHEVPDTKETEAEEKPASSTRLLTNNPIKSNLFSGSAFSLFTNSSKKKKKMSRKKRCEEVL